MSDLMLDVDQAGELKAAFRRWNWTNRDVKRFCESSQGPDFLKVLTRQAEVVLRKHVIDCDADPFLPKGWKGVEFHRKHGQLEFASDKVNLYLSKEQVPGKYIVGTDLRKELENVPVYNANVLDYLLAHPELISESWKGKAVFFWGTIYRDADGGLCVRYLYWGGAVWGWFCYWLGCEFDCSGPAASEQVA